MPAYQYTAIDQKGKQQKGVVEADSARQVRQQLREQQLTPIQVTTSEKNRNNTSGGIFNRKMAAYDLALMTRQLSVLIAASIPLEESLRSVAKQTEKRHVQNILMAVRSKVLEGHSLASALSQASGFPPLYIATIAAGEKSGHLDIILEQLADYTESRHAMQRQVQSAMIYPSILMFMAFVIVIGLMVYVLPSIVKMFENNQDALPWITQFLMKASNFLVQFWPFLIVGFLFFAFLIRRFLKTDAGHYSLDGWALRLPIIGKLSRGVNAARFASTLAILTRSGVPLVEALHIGAAVTNNWHIRDTIRHAALKVTEGGNLAVQLERSKLFPPMMIQMIRSGENSGELDKMLVRASDMQDREVSTMITSMLALLEPLMLVIMAAIVMTIVIAVMLPIVNMNNLV